MKQVCLILLFLTTFFKLLIAQAPPKQWDVRFGGSGQDQLWSLKQTSDGGYILGGTSLSGASGNKTQALQGSFDYWIVKVNSSGVKQWDASFGGTTHDYLSSLQQTSDGGYILGGTSYSGATGDKSQATKGGSDFWIVKVNSLGVKQWDASFGGSSFESLNSLQQTSDGGYILGGYSQSGISGDKTQGTQGSYDYWIVKVNSLGAIVWDATFGGSSVDILNSLQQTSDGGYILGGYSNSVISGDKTQGTRGLNDYWIVKVNSVGAKLWDARFGGSSDDQLTSLQQTSEGGYILGGFSNSILSGDKTQGTQGNNDYWMVKVNSLGVKEWDARFGGNSQDDLNSLQQTSDGEYILGGFSYSGISGDKTQASQGFSDYWIVKVNASGAKLWDARFGGTNSEICNSLQKTVDNGYILGGYSDSGISGDKTQTSQGSDDYWIVKLVGIVTNSITGSPFCSGSSLNVPFTVSGTLNGGNIFTAQLSDAAGSFASPTTIGTLASTTSGTISATIPSGTTAGTAYRIRVVSNDPVIIGSDNAANISIQPFTTNIFLETMGTSLSSVTVASHETSNGFDNDNFNMTGTNATVENLSQSSGYAGSSGLANVLIDAIASSFFQIEGINTLNRVNMQLSFGVRKNSNPADGSSLVVEVSSDGTNFSALTFSPLPSGGGTSNTWYLRTAIGTLPQASNLRIRFRVLNTQSTFRIDDVKLTETNTSAGITATGTTVLCSPATATLNASFAQSYLWSNNAVTQSIVTSTAGNYYSALTSNNGCVLVSNTIVVTDATPAPFNVTGGGQYCVSGTPVTVGLSGSQTGVNYQLKLNNVNLGSAIGGTGNAISFGNQTTLGTYTVFATNIAASCTNTMNGNATITADPLCPLAGIYCIGPSAAYTPPSGPAYINGSSPYPTITAAVNALNTLGTSSHVIFELQNNYTSTAESFPITITYQGTPTSTAVFRPRSDISSMINIINPNTSGSSVIKFDGADYVTIDGSPGGTLGTTIMLMVRSTLNVITQDAHDISFINDATHNTINAVQVEGATENYCIYFRTTTGLNGNDYNTIQNCILRNRSDNNNNNLPKICIYSKGTGTGLTANNNILIQNNRIFNFSTDGIYINSDGNNGKWDIIGNHFYSTFTIPFQYMIVIQPTDTATITLSNNYFGGTAPFAGGIPLPFSSGASFSAVYLLLNNTSPNVSTVSNNVIKNMALAGGFSGILVQSGVVNVENNTIGDPAVSNDIIQGISSNVGFSGIYYTSSQNIASVNITGNTINNILMQNSTTIGTSVTCFNYLNSVLVNGSATISGNRIKNFNYAGKSTFTCLNVSGKDGAPGNTIIADNKFESIISSNDVGLEFTGITCNSAPVSIVGNRIGNFTIANDITVAGGNTHRGIYVPSGNGIRNIQNDTVANITSSKGNNISVLLNGITLNASGGFANNVSNNIIMNLSTASIKSDIETSSPFGYALTGILVSSGGSGQVLANNTITGLHATSISATANPVVVGIGVTTDNFSVQSNRIFDLTNTATNTSSYPIIFGIRTSSNPGTVSFSNNMIALSNGMNSNGVRIYGLYDNNAAATTPVNTYYYNSIAISGNTTNAARSAAFWRNTSNSGATIRNNIFYNSRTGGTGKHYAIGHETGVSSVWNSSTSDNNDLYSTDPLTVGYWGGVNKTFTTWKTISNGDANSKNSNVNFVDVNSDLHLAILGNCNLNGTATPVSTNVDIDNQTRSLTVPDIGCDEFSPETFPEICGNGIDDNCNSLIDEGCQVTMNIKLFIAGFYSGNGLMEASPGHGCLNLIDPVSYPVPEDVDDVSVSVMGTSSPFAVVESRVGRLKTNGDLSVSFNGPAIPGVSYYLRITNRNLVQTWSKLPVLFSSPITSYDFTIASTQAFDDGFTLPMKLVDTNPERWAFFNGDINQDGGVDSQDMTIEENDSNAAAFGYNASDLNGDGSSDSLDMTIIENNSNVSVFTAHP